MSFQGCWRDIANACVVCRTMLEKGQDEVYEPSLSLTLTGLPRWLTQSLTLAQEVMNSLASVLFPVASHYHVAVATKQQDLEPCDKNPGWSGL